jgi:chromosome segregation ATPase
MNKRKILNIAFIFVISLMLICASFNSMASELYKWVDEEGNVHFGDAIPPEQVKSKHSTLSESGKEIESMEKQKSAQELERERQLVKQKEEEEKRKAADQERIKKEQRAYDQVLLQTYASEQDLINMRDRQISTIEGTITLSESNVKKLEAQLEKITKEANSADPNSEIGKKVLEELKDARQQLIEYQQFVSNRRAEQDKIRSQFNRDLQRLRELLLER